MLFKHIVFFHHCFFTDFDHPKLWFVGAFEFITCVTTCLTPIISYNHGFYNANLCFDGSKNRWPPWILPLNHWGQRIKVRSSPMNHLCPKRRISLYHVAFSTMIPFSSNYIILRTMSLYIYIYLYIYISLLVRHPCPYPHLQLAVLAPFHQLPGPVPWPRPSTPRYGGNDPRLSVVLGDGRGVGWWSPGGGFQDGNVHQIMTRTGPYGYIWSLWCQYDTMDSTNMCIHMIPSISQIMIVTLT
jgi:hypothetical protein